MPLVEVEKGFLYVEKLEDQKLLTGEAAWSSAVYLPGVLSAGIEKWISGKVITPEIHHNQVMLILDGEAEIRERSEEKTSVVEAGDVVLLKVGAKLTITPKKPVKCFFVTVPPYQETPTDTSLTAEDQ